MPLPLIMARYHSSQSNCSVGVMGGWNALACFGSPMIPATALHHLVLLVCYTVHFPLALMVSPTLLPLLPDCSHLWSLWKSSYGVDCSIMGVALSPWQLVSVLYLSCSDSSSPSLRAHLRNSVIPNWKVAFILHFLKCGFDAIWGTSRLLRRTGWRTLCRAPVSLASIHRCHWCSSFLNSNA